MSRKRRAMMQPRNFDIWELSEARYQFWLGDYAKCSKLIFPLCRKYVQEPLIGSEEYKDGERKPAESVRKQTEEEDGKSEDFEWPPFLIESITNPNQEPERDDDGYLIR